MTHLLITFTLLFPLLLVAAVLSLTARSRRGIVFGVSLPLDIADSTEVKASIARFHARLLAFSACVFLLIVALAAAGRMNAAAIASTAGVLAVLAVTFRLRAQEAKRLQAQAITPPLTRTAELTLPDTTPALALTAAPLLLVAGVALWLRMHWEQIAERWPQHWNAAGKIDGWGHRTAAGVFGTLVMAAVVVLVMTAINLFNAKAPGPQAAQRARFAAPLAAMSWALTLIFCVLGLTPLYRFGLGTLLGMIALSMVAILGVVLWSIARSGFFSSTSTNWTAEPYDGTPDHNWHAGLFYANRNDPAVLVPKRFGYGWTLNFARPVAWVFMSVVLLLCAASVALPFLAHKR